jgi:hypothetical protein
MAFWFGKKKQAELREAILPGEMGTMSFPADFLVEMEDERTLLAQAKGNDAIILRASSLSISRKDGNDETAGKIAVRERAEKGGLQFIDNGDKGMLSYEEPSEQDGVPLLIKYWYVGSKNTFVIFSATIVAAERDSKRVKAVLELIPRILDSLKITKIHRTIVAEGREVETIETTAEPTPQSIEPFGPTEEAWLQEGLERATALGIKYGSGGTLTPEELDVVFSRWMYDEEGKESDDAVANALGAAFGDYIVEQHGFRWVVVTDEYGTEYAVRHRLGSNTAFPRASVQKRIEDKCPEFFQNVYLIVLDQLKRSAEEQKQP